MRESIEIKFCGLLTPELNLQPSNYTPRQTKNPAIVFSISSVEASDSFRGVAGVLVTTLSRAIHSVFEHGLLLYWI